MVTTFNDSDDLEKRLKFLGPNTDKWELEEILESAHRKMRSKVGRTIEEELRLERREQTVFDLAFPEVFEVSEVDWRDESVDSDNYTVTKEPASIEFDNSWAQSNYIHSEDRPVVEYTPSIFKELELMLALEEIMNLSSIQTGDDETQAMFEQYRERRKELVKTINRKSQNLTSRNRGKRVASNYNFPGERY